MASVIKDPNGTRRIQFVLGDSRPTIRLGKCSQRDAAIVARRVEALVSAKLNGAAIDATTATWLGTVHPKLREKLARVGLIEGESPKAAVTLGQHLANYFAARTDVAKNTLVHWRHTRRCLLAYFGENRPLASITAGEAKDWERWLKTPAARPGRKGTKKPANTGLAVNTIRKRCSNAKQFFADAIARELLTKNPFAGLKGTVGSNRARDYFIDRETVEKVLAVMPDNEWRLIFVLARYGGLRVPTEPLALTWDDVLWDQGKILVRSIKTAHHEGKESRIVPLFPELRPYLNQAWDEAKEGAKYVISRYRQDNANLRTQLLRYIERAGVPAWPKLFQNLRSSRSTELANNKEVGPLLGAEWLGHSVAVAAKHYWQVTDADYAKASGMLQNASEKAAQNAAQLVREMEVNEGYLESNARQQNAILPRNSKPYPLVDKRSMGGTGLEPVTSTV